MLDVLNHVNKSHFPFKFTIIDVIMQEGFINSFAICIQEGAASKGDPHNLESCSCNNRTSLAVVSFSINDSHG